MWLWPSLIEHLLFVHLVWRVPRIWIFSFFIVFHFLISFLVTMHEPFIFCSFKCHNSEPVYRMACDLHWLIYFLWYFLKFLLIFMITKKCKNCLSSSDKNCKYMSDICILVIVKWTTIWSPVSNWRTWQVLDRFSTQSMKYFTKTIIQSNSRR